MRLKGRKQNRKKNSFKMLCNPLLLVVFVSFNLYHHRNFNNQPWLSGPNSTHSLTTMGRKNCVSILVSFLVFIRILPSGKNKLIDVIGLAFWTVLCSTITVANSLRKAFTKSFIKELDLD